jgi:hypothetical protein
MQFAYRRCTLVEILSRKGVTFCVMPDHSRQARSGISSFRPPYPFAPFKGWLDANTLEDSE